MLLQPQPNSYSCLLTAFASVAGIKVQKFIELVGHDGKELVWPQLLSPQCFRNWHYQELIKACLSIGWAVTPIDRWIETSPGPGIQSYEINHSDYFDSLLVGAKGVVAVKTNKGIGHALIFDQGKFYDPATGKATKLINFYIRDQLWLFNRIKETIV